MITDLTDLGPLATSDHKALQWSMQIRTVSTSGACQVFDYTKADTPAILKELAAVDWNNLFSNQSVDSCWETFKSVLQNAENKYVPLKAVNSSKGKPMWMTHKALKAVKFRHREFKKYQDPSHPACKKANRQGRKKFVCLERILSASLQARLKMIRSRSSHMQEVKPNAKFK